MGVINTYSVENSTYINFISILALKSPSIHHSFIGLHDIMANGQYQPLSVKCKYASLFTYICQYG